jgi:hypothetical protein
LIFDPRAVHSRDFSLSSVADRPAHTVTLRRR